VSVSAENPRIPSRPPIPPREFSLKPPRKWRPAPTSWVALGLLVLTGAAVWLWLDGVLREWTPGFAVSAFVLAASVTVIPAVLRRQADARVRRRVEPVINEIHNSLYLVVEDILVDAAETQPDQAFDTSDLHEIFDLLCWAHMTCALTIPSSKEHPAQFVLIAREFARQLARTRERERDVLEPDLIRAIDDFCRAIQRADRDYAAAPDDLITDPASVATFGVLEGVRRFAWEFQRWVPEKLELGEYSREVIERRITGAQDR
jgi:hypothetical protein